MTAKLSDQMVGKVNCVLKTCYCVTFLHGLLISFKSICPSFRVPQSTKGFARFGPIRN